MSLDQHNRFCSAAGWPCPIHCETWPKCSAEMFPNLIGACPSMCPVHTTWRLNAEPADSGR